MKQLHYLFLAAWGLSFMPVVHAQVPGILSYQGRLSHNNGNYAGPVRLKFALVDGVNGTTYWANDDGTSVNGSEPAAFTTVNASGNGGFFSLMLGDTTLPDMDIIPHSVFSHPDVRLRVWVSTGEPAFTLLTPDQRMAPVGYAMQAASLPNGGVTSAMLANNAVIGAKLAPGAVTGAHLAAATISADKLIDGSITGLKIAQNSLSSEDIADTLRLRDLQVESAGGLDRVQLTEVGNSGVLYMNHGTIGRFLEAWGTNDGGFLRLYDGFGGIGTAQATVEMGSSSVGGYLRALQDNKATGVMINGQNGAQPGGAILVYRETGLGATLLGSASGGQGALFTMYNGQGNSTVSLDADASGNGSALAMYSGSGVNSLFLDADSSGSGLIEVKDTDGTATIRLIGAQSGTAGGRLEMYQANGAASVILDGEVGTGGGGYIQLRKGDGTGTITLDADSSGEGRITTQVLEITGGSDLSENFDIQSANAQPGMITCIDPEHPGELIISQGAYDRTVAGIVSGAGGVKPGMLMGQRNSKADGKHPVALTGRVYCFADAEQGAIVPGDLITTSDTPGHGMKVTDHTRAQGAIIGKAMTGLARGRGLVLILVSLQ